MKRPDIHTTRPVIPTIYAYTTPQIADHNGWLKIGDTEQTVEDRIRQQSHTADVATHIEWISDAVYDDGTGKTFRDYDFHRYLIDHGIPRLSGTEWFKIAPQTARNMLMNFKQHINTDPTTISSERSIPYKLRDEQEDAVSRTIIYYQEHRGERDAEYLWNAKPRFGKTLSVYEFCRRIKAEHVLILTNRPVVVTSWYDDYVKFVRGWDELYYFASDSDELKKYVQTSGRYKYYSATDSELLKGCSYFTFVSLQDLKGSSYFGGHIPKLKHIHETHWDVVVLDESHEGTTTFKAETALRNLNHDFTLYLSGTPFKALASSQFSNDQIFNWTYVDEQQKKASWCGEGNNPYAILPKLNLYTYRMSDIVRDQVKQGIVDDDDDVEEYAFDLNEFFATNDQGHFIHLAAVNQFIDSLITQDKFPFSTQELRNELKHTLWLLDRVDSAKELVRLLRRHPVFENYQIIPAVGDGKLDNDDQNDNAFDAVYKAIHGDPEHHLPPAEKTITVSVGQLTTGVTIPEWTGVLMLSNIKSASLYMQAAFRAQNPCLMLNIDKQRGTRTYLRKTQAYVFDFDPARTLDLYDQFANGLYTSTAAGKGTAAEHKEHIGKLLNFFPVLGEDENGSMVPLDAEQVLSVPRKIRSQEVVRRGFLSNFLFQNISNVFAAPKEIIDIINSFPAIEDPKKKKPLPDDIGSDLNLNNNGEVDIPDSIVIGTATDIFGDKHYGEQVAEIIDNEVVNSADQTEDDRKKQLEAVKNAANATIIPSIIDHVKSHYGDEMKTSDEKSLETMLKQKSDYEIEKQFADFSVKVNANEADRQNELAKSETSEEDERINEKYDKNKEQLSKELTANITTALTQTFEESKKESVEHVETRIQERKRNIDEEDVRKHLRGFSRTIPSFVMAYGGDNKITLENFDEIVPGDVFQEVTSISLAQFRLLRDGGDYTANDGSRQHFYGHLFDEVVFDDSVAEFLNVKKKLANYFDSKQTEDIFTYIPPQKTNQIFTPRAVVKEMVDDLEKENPGCFDDPNATFVDLYMKSGMYITEIVKRLYNSDHLKKIYPDNVARLNHIFGKQVYGLAPTEIIYRICVAYILGFSDHIKIEKNNIRKCDALRLAEEGNLKQELIKLFPNLDKG